ncbi:hypothetical protein DE146DRAFT_736161 [Phaeosphaeria sp. MPI-PUGE-AT-0046c]|nr:hypothetical protein DE146DRAFT_736161 [Phaeosphaeria sp. MPI-PUGE-AT-0046c]
MGITKQTKTFFAHGRKKLAEPSQSNMQTADVQANKVLTSDVRSENVGRNAASGPQFDSSMQPNGSLGRPVPPTPSFNTGPPVPPHTSQPFSAANVPSDGNATRSQPMITRRPTQSEDLAKTHPGASEKQLPPLKSTISSGPPLSEQLLCNTTDQNVPQSDGLEVMEASGQMLSQAGGSQSHSVDVVEGPVSLPNQTVGEQSDQTHAQEMKALRDSNYQHAAQIEILRNELQIEKERHAQTTQAWRKAAAALSANRPEANYKVDDDTLRNSYQNIFYEVSSWVATYCVPNFDHVPESELRVFNKLTLHPQKYYRFSRTRELLLQSLVMHDLVELVLNGGLWWAGKQSVGLCMVQFTLEPDEARAIPTLLMNNSLRVAEVRDYSAWKAKTALLLSEKVSKSAVHANVGSVAAEMQKLLKPFVQRTIPTAWKELEAVILKAIMLDHELNKSRALSQVHRWSAEKLAEMQFDEKHMATPNGLKAARSGMKVELVLAPMITKTGNADGEAFDSLTLISPWVVVCYENRKQMQKK